MIRELLLVTLLLLIFWSVKVPISARGSESVVSLTTSTLLDISADEYGNLWLAGKNGTIIKTPSGALLMTSTTTEDLLRIEMVTHANGWAIGKDTILHWDGDTWYDYTTLINGLKPLTNTSYELTFKDISMIDSSDGWIVGEWDSYKDRLKTKFPNQSSKWESGIMLHWDGHYWNVFNEFGTFPPLRSVSMVSKQLGWITGSSGVYGYDFTAGTKDFDNVYRWNGAFWVGENRTNVGSRYLFALNSSNVWVADPNMGVNQITHWNGSSWNAFTGGFQYDKWYAQNIFFLDERDGWVPVIIPPPDVDKMEDYRYGIVHWDGTQWKIQGETLPMSITVVKFFGEHDGWAAGSYGTVLSWNGTSWETYATSYLPTPASFWTQWSWFLVPLIAVVVIVSLVFTSIALFRRKQRKRTFHTNSDHQQVKEGIAVKTVLATLLIGKSLGWRKSDCPHRL